MTRKKFNCRDIIRDVSFVDGHKSRSKLERTVGLSEIFHAYRLMTADGRHKYSITDPLLANDA